MEETAEVIKVMGKRALVKIKRHSACSKCESNCSLAGESEIEDLEVEVNNIINAQVGQLIKLEMEGQPLVLASLIVYLIPVIFLITGYFVGQWTASFIGITVTEGTGIFGAVFFFFLSFIIVRYIDKKMGVNSKFHPRIKEVISQ